jgi:hypothetical protein
VSFIGFHTCSSYRLKSVFEGRAEATSDITETTTQTATAQLVTGWEHLLRGRLSQVWYHAQQDPRSTFQPKKNSTTGATKVIKELLQGWLDLSHFRNGERHGRDAQ